MRLQDVRSFELTFENSAESMQLNDGNLSAFFLDSEKLALQELSDHFCDSRHLILAQFRIHVEGEHFLRRSF